MANQNNESKQGDILSTLGGPIGILESLIPGTVYVTVFSLTLNVVLSAVLAGSISLVFAILQIIRKKPLTQVFAGMVGLAISIYLPLRDGLNDTHAADYFLPGLLTNLAYFAALSVSLLFRVPLIGFALALFTGTQKTWRTDRVLYRRYYWITVMWVAMFALRIAVQGPLYLSGQVAALGVAKLVLGTPLYALVIWFSWLAARVSDKSSK
ncbi:MAG: hypothetical protein RL140_341 [Actinomycetota bacterium]|jgi:hypothetical protein